MEDDYFGYMHQGSCLLNLGRTEEAVPILEKAEQAAAAASPQILTDIYQELAFAYGDLHKLDQALYYIDKAEQLDCDHVNMEVIRGHILLSNNQAKEAEFAFKKALRLSDNAPKTMLRIIVSLYDNQYLHTCYILFKKFFMTISSDWTDGYSYMALCCLDLKKHDEFLYYLDQAVKRNPKEARTVLSGLFPEGTLPEEYIAYISNQTNKGIHMNFITNILNSLGWYPTIFVLMLLESTVVPVPSEFVVTPAAYHAASGSLNVFLVIFYGTLGADIGASINYFVAPLRRQTRYLQVRQQQVG